MANVYRADHVGPLIKPATLLATQAAFVAGKAEAAALGAAQDAAIREALNLQKDVVMTVLTDGELRRASADEPYVGALAGAIRHGGGGRPTVLRSEYVVCGELPTDRRLTEAEARFLQASTRAAIKICMLSPSSLAVRFFGPAATAAYRSVQDLAVALSRVVQREIDALVAQGVRYVQLNGPAYDALFDGAGLGLLDLPGLDPAAAFDELVAIDAAMLRSLVMPADTAVAMHVGRHDGVDHAGGRYERLVARLLEELPVNRVLLEYAESSEQDFTALQGLPAGTVAVLGLVRNRDPEDVGTVIGRIEQAARYTPEETLALSPRRGFINSAASAADRELDAQRQTLIRASEVVQQFWGLEL
jgi:5-methyltetrahydropteroyltriglutamate--homocysteine methyltransferase